MDKEPTVLFVCEHGSAKSVVAAAHFNRLAMERRVGLRAVSRGTNPDDEIAPNAARGLDADGFALEGETPKRLSTGDVEAAERVVAFCPLPEAFGETTGVEVREGVPPVSECYETARHAIVERVSRLLDELAEPARGASGGARP